MTSIEFTKINTFNENQDIILRRFIEIISNIISENQDFNQNTLSAMFCGKRKTSITLDQYFVRLCKYINFESSTLIISMVYLDRFCSMNGIKINVENIHRLLFLSLMLAIKYNEDVHYTNVAFSQIAGINIKSLNSLELTFLEKIEHNLYVDEDLYLSYLGKTFRY